MKIIKEGKKKEEKEVNTTCYKCEAVLSYSASDIQSDRDGRFVVCPCCNAFIGV